MRSGKAYRVEDSIGEGGRLYVDRDYTFSSVPDIIAGAQYIMTANNDKHKMGDDFLSFTINRDASVTFTLDGDDVTAQINGQPEQPLTGLNLAAGLYVIDLPSGLLGNIQGEKKPFRIEATDLANTANVQVADGAHRLVEQLVPA